MLVLANLPTDVSTDEIQELLGSFGPARAVDIRRQAEPPYAVIETELSREQTEALVHRLEGRIHRGCELRAWMPLLGGDAPQ